jgi:hypothetical protein
MIFEKTILVSLIVLSSIPVWAAKINNPKCKDFVEISDKFTPEYLAVVDGYDKKGRETGDQVDVVGIVTESDKLKEECAKDKTATLKNVRKNLKKIAATNPPAVANTTRINPTKAKCSDFIALSEEYQPIAAFWVAGHSKSGKAKSGEVDEEYLEQPVATLIEDCKAAPTASFYEKTKIWLKKKI